MSPLPTTSVQQTRRQTQRRWLVLVQLAWLVVAGLSIAIFFRNIPATYA
jgi:DMSO/TMAO reductase YedYZ heme-binding membrane subunit